MSIVDMNNIKFTAIGKPRPFTHMVVESIGHIELIDGVWTDKKGNQYDVQKIDGTIQITNLNNSTGENE